MLMKRIALLFSSPITLNPTILFSIPHFPRYVSYSSYFLIVQLSNNFRWCLERVQKTHKERCSHPPAS